MPAFVPSKVSARDVFVALGSNVSLHGQSPLDTLEAALLQLETSGPNVVSVSSLYVTEAIGGGRQPRYVNAVVRLRTSSPPATLLRLLKRIERSAGRRLGRHWGPRTLDLDIVSAGAVYMHSQASLRVRGQLILPHPEMHKRAFVLLPLSDVAPAWWHPRLKRSITQLLATIPVRRQLRGVERASMQIGLPNRDGLKSLPRALI